MRVGWERACCGSSLEAVTMHSSLPSSTAPPSHARPLQLSWLAARKFFCLVRIQSRRARACKSPASLAASQNWASAPGAHGPSLQLLACMPACPADPPLLVISETFTSPPDLPPSARGALRVTPLVEPPVFERPSLRSAGAMPTQKHAKPAARKAVPKKSVLPTEIELPDGTKVRMRSAPSRSACSRFSRWPDTTQRN